MRRLLRQFIPPIAIRAYHSIAGEMIRFRGEFVSWEEASAASSGYDSDAIFHKTREAALKVKCGEVAFERDSVVFDRVEFSFPVLAGLLRVACARGGELNVLDFGGALGSTYRQFKAFGVPLRALRWNVVEQPHFVECGREMFQDAELRFFETIGEVVRDCRPDVVLLSSVLQYIKCPYDLIEQINLLDWAHVLVDRTPCASADRDVLTVQSVPSTIYKASYPCWVFSTKKLIAACSVNRSLLTSFQEPSGPWLYDRGEFFLQGFIFGPRSQVG